MSLQKILKRLPGSYKLLLILFLWIPFNVSGFISEKKINKEVEITPDTKIYTKGLRTPKLRVNGTINTNSEIGAYTLKGLGKKTVLRVDRKFNVHTWDRPFVKQEMTIKVEAKDKATEEAILRAIEASLKLDPTNTLVVDYLVGIDMITMVNGWFKRDVNSLEFDDGQNYDFNTLIISGSLTVPKDASLTIEGDYLDIKLGSFTGSLNLNLNDSRCEGRYVKQLDGKLNASKINIHQVGTAEISAHRSFFFIEEVDSIMLGNKRYFLDDIFSMSSFGTDQFGRNLTSQDKNCSLNEIDLEQVNYFSLANSLNDEYSIGQLMTGEFRDVAFSEIEIGQLQKGITGDVLYGEFNVFGFKSTTFENFELEATKTSLQIHTGAIPDFQTIITYNKSINSSSGLQDRGVVEAPGFQTARLLENNRVQFIKGGGEKLTNKVHLICNGCRVKLK